MATTATPSAAAGWKTTRPARSCTASSLTTPLHGATPTTPLPPYTGNQLASVRQAAGAWSSQPGRYPALTSTQREFLRAAQPGYPFGDK
jgi:hypothetical protein